MTVYLAVSTINLVYLVHLIVLLLIIICRFWGTDGLVCFGGTWLILRKCGGLQTWLRFLYLGLSFTLLPFFYLLLSWFSSWSTGSFLERQRKSSIFRILDFSFTGSRDNRNLSFFHTLAKLCQLLELGLEDLTTYWLDVEFCSFHTDLLSIKWMVTTGLFFYKFEFYCCPNIPFEDQSKNFWNRNIKCINKLCKHPWISIWMMFLA